MALLGFAFWAVVTVSVAADDVLVLEPPQGKTGDPAAWIILPGAEIGKDTYEPLGRAVQSEVSIPLWVAVLGTYLTPSPVPGEIGPRIDAVLKEMSVKGLDLQKVRLFYGGHSLGSVFIQDHLYSYHGSQGPLQGKISVLGQVLMGGFIQRKYNFPTPTYPVSTLTIGGELDGLARCTRLAEAFHTAAGNSDFPVAIIRGMTHMQFSSGTPPALVKARDLHPEISYAAAYAEVAKLVAPYFAKLAGVDAAAATFSAQLSATGTADFVKPILAAYELEGARYINEPGQMGGPDESTCKKNKGLCKGQSPWAPTAQKLVSAVDGWHLDISNRYVDVSSTPIGGGEFHLPAITNNSASKTLAITTYSQCYFDSTQPSWFDWKEIFDKFDTGFIATSAEEIGTKLLSRQCTLIRGLGQSQSSTPFSVDDPSFCAETNKKAYEWAQQNAGSAAANRFSQYGQKYTFGDDLPKGGGPWFLKSRLQFNEVTGATGEKEIQVVSPALKTEIDYWVKHFGRIPRPSALPDPGCYHHCKLLSPARVMEWIYVDSLRLKRGLSSAQEASAHLGSFDHIAYV